jgi:hypothetical protein
MDVGWLYVALSWSWENEGPCPWSDLRFATPFFLVIVTQDYISLLNQPIPTILETQTPPTTSPTSSNLPIETMKRSSPSDSDLICPSDKRLKPNHDWTGVYGPGDYAYSPTESLCESPPSSDPPVNDLGYKGKFTLFSPDHVVLESLDGPKMSVAKLALVHSR